MAITVKMNENKDSNIVSVGTLNVGDVIKYDNTISIFLGEIKNNYYAWDIKNCDKELDTPKLSFFYCGMTRVELLQKSVEVVVG